MKFVLEINCDNAAFDERSLEVAHILTRITERVISRKEGGKIYDSNGNHVGEWGFKEGTQ